MQYAIVVGQHALVAVDVFVHVEVLHNQVPKILTMEWHDQTITLSQVDQWRVHLLKTYNYKG